MGDSRSGIRANTTPGAGTDGIAASNTVALNSASLSSGKSDVAARATVGSAACGLPLPFAFLFGFPFGFALAHPRLVRLVRGGVTRSGSVSSPPSGVGCQCRASRLSESESSSMMTSVSGCAELRVMVGLGGPSTATTSSIDPVELTGDMNDESDDVSESRAPTSTIVPPATEAGGAVTSGTPAPGAPAAGTRASCCDSAWAWSTGRRRGVAFRFRLAIATRGRKRSGLE